MKEFKRVADCHVHGSSDLVSDYRMLDELAELNITDLSLLATPVFEICWQGHCIDDNLAALALKTMYKKIRIRAFGGFHYDRHFGGIPYEKQAENLLAAGFDGIKLIEMKPNCRKAVGKGLCDPGYDRAFSMLEELGTPVLAHVNDPETFWDKSTMTQSEIDRGWWYGDGTYLTNQAIYDEVFAMLDKHPKLNITFAHFFFLSNKLEEAERVMDRYPNVKFDLTPGWEMYVGFTKQIEKWREFFTRHNTRILYGTDSNCVKTGNSEIHKVVRLGISHDMSEYRMPIWNPTVRGLELDSETIGNICYNNYIRFAGAETKAVSTDSVVGNIDEMISKIKPDPVQKDAVIRLETLKTALLCSNV